MMKRTWRMLAIASLWICGCPSSEVYYSGELPDEMETPTAPPGFDPNDMLATTPGMHLLPGVDFFDLTQAGEGELERTEGAVVLLGETAAMAARMGRGDIIYGNQGDDFIYRVIGIERGEGRVTLEITAFAMSDVIYGDFENDWTIERSELMTREQMLDAARFSAELNLDNGFSFETGLGLSVEKIFEFDGKIQAKASFFIGSKTVGFGDRDKDDCRNVLVDTKYGPVSFYTCIERLKMGVKATLSPTAKASWKFTKEVRKDGTFFENSAHLGTIKGVIGPLDLRFEAFVDAPWELWAKGQLIFGDVGVTGSKTYQLGFEYAGGSFNALPLNGGDSLSYYTPKGAISLEAGASAKIRGGLDVYLSANAGLGRVDLGPAKLAASLEGKVTYKPLDSDACLKASVKPGVAIEFLPKIRVDPIVGKTFDFELIKGKAKIDLAPGLSPLWSWDGGGEYCLSAEELAERKRLLEMFDFDEELCQGRASGDTSAPTSFADTCAPAFLDHCYKPRGQCFGVVYTDNSYQLDWQSGHAFHGAPRDMSSMFSFSQSTRMIDTDGSNCTLNETTASLTPNALGYVEWEFVLQKDEEENPMGFLRDDKMTVQFNQNGSFTVECTTENEEIDPEYELGPTSVPAPRNLTTEQDFFCTVGMAGCQMRFEDKSDRGWTLSGGW